MSKEQPEAIIFEKIKRLCRNANCAYTVMNYYETVIIPARLKAERETILIKLRSKLKIACGVISITQKDLFELDTDIFPIRPEVKPDGTVSNWDKLSEDTKQRYSKQLKQEGI